MEADPLAQKMKKLRKRLGMTQEQVARDLGITMNSVAMWERGERTPTGLYRKALENWIEQKDGRKK